ncbi:hypothetical protein [Candidatus Albibeggiatoa sp. nov. NOAA]|uniref:hypothetical protein n=1 Tax=Candidatus Albibeggiatoa sp. nov. NOAA TaxID=3162724 RepID=UPI0032FD588A|nr:hypothetical protein [Thiotrichaceae bacterium]
MVFSKIIDVELPKRPLVGKGFSVTMVTDGEVPFPQMVVRQDDGSEHFIKDELVSKKGKNRYRFQVPAEQYQAGKTYLQIEGCRIADLDTAQADDWVKVYHEITVNEPASKKNTTKRTRKKPSPVTQ